jgi:hypothetical protein
LGSGNFNKWGHKHNNRIIIGYNPISKSKHSLWKNSHTTSSNNEALTALIILQWLKIS